MKAHTSQFKEDIKTIGKQLDSKIIYELDGVVQTLTSEQLNSITPTFQGAILKSVMKELDIDSNVDIPIGTKVNYQFGLKTEGDFEYVNYGNYIVYSSEKQEDYDSYKIVCYDKMLYSMKKNEDLGITYPKTIRDYINALCNKLGLEFKNKDDEFANFDRQIGEELYAGQDYTYRDIFDQLAEVTASTICLDENDKVEIRYINDLTDLYTVNGKEVTFESDIEYPMSFQVNGNTEQTTYNGKNLLNYIYNLQSTNGLTNIINSDGSITTTGKPTTNYTRIVTFLNFIDFFEDGETYTISQQQPSEKLFVQVNAKKKDGTYSYYFSNKGKSTFKVDKDTYVSYYIGVQTNAMSMWGDSPLTITNKYMLCKGTDTADTSFEPYVGRQPSPSPDYPQEIVNVRGVENLFNINDKTTVTGAASVDKDDWITITYDNTKGTNTAYLFYNTNNLNLKTSTRYIAITEIKSVSGTGTISPVSIYQTGGQSSTNIIYGFNVLSNNSIKTSIFATRSNFTNVINGMRTYVRFDKGQSGSITFRLSVLEDTTITSEDFIYEPYGINYMRLKNIGKNFWRLYNTQTFNGVTLTQNADGSVLLNGTATADTFFKIALDETINEATTLSCDYKSGTISGGSVFIRTRTSKNIINHLIDVGPASTQGIKLEHKTAENYYQEITIQKNAVLSNVLLETMLLKGTYSVAELPIYEPYKSKSILIDLKGNELCSNKDKTVKDNLFVTNKGKVEIFKKIGEYVFTGDEKFVGEIKSGLFCVNTKIQNMLRLPNRNINQMNSHFFNSTKDVVGGCFNYLTYLYMFPTSDITSTEEFKAKLKSLYDAGTPVKVQYELENPEAIELDTVKPLKSYIGQNNISNNADADMNVTYSKNYETIDANFLKDINVNFGKKYGPVNSIVLSRSAESDNIYLQDEESITKNGLCEIKIKDNQIMNWNDRSDYLPDILEKLDGLEYYLNDFASTGIAYLDLCDKYNVNVFENNYPCIMFNDELLVTQGLEENVHTNMPEETQTDYTKSDKTDRRINQAYIIVDKQQQEITSLTKQTNSIQDNLTKNYYTIEQSNTLIQNAQSGLTNTFSEAGGNNIFRNTGLWFSQSDVDNPYEYWTGKNVSKQNTDKSSNGSLMMLKKGTLEQEQVVSNGNYTVSFKYKKLIQLATCKVIVNDNEYELTQMTDTEWQTGSKDADGNIVIKPLEVTSNHINVKFTSTVDNAIEIYDLMVNAGTVKLAYSQNENEVTTDTVNISKGITITSSANDTKFKANADGIRIVDKNNEKTILTKFTDKGMSTKELEVENSATIVKVLVQNVGSQTWFTRI